MTAAPISFRGARSHPTRVHTCRGRVSMKRPSRGIVLVGAATAVWVLAFSYGVVESQSATEAPTGFDNRTNGHISQTAFDTAKATFEERDEIGDGLGPVYNAQGCIECHQNPVTGAG